MAIIRKQNFKAFSGGNVTGIELIDTPEKLLNFIATKGIVTVPLDVKRIAELFNIDIQLAEMKDDLSGKLFKNEEDNSWIIQVNKNHHPNRQRYTIAHELGHYCLHRHLKKIFEDQIFFRGTESCTEEWQANEFASSILMPENKFREMVRRGTTDIEELARKFEVSTLALRIRAKTLGMTGHGL